jgi:hypothetical protein
VEECIVLDSSLWFPILVAAASLRGFQGLRLFNNFIASALRRSKRLILVSMLAGSLQFMTLLPGVAFVLVVAFLATAVALNAGLVGCPFRFRLGSFVLFVVRTRLAFGYIDLHLLQPVIVVLPVGDISFSLSVRSILSVTAFLF